MNICILAHDDNPKGGGGRYAGQLVAALQRRGHQTVLLTEVGGALPILRRKIGIIGAAFRTIRYLRKCDIIHALDVYPNGVIAWLANLITHKPLILTVHGTYSIAPLSSPYLGWLVRRIYSSADLIVSISSYNVSRIRERVPDAHIIVINPGIVTSEHQQNKTKTEIPLRIISVGGLKMRKGYHISIEAFARARERIPGLQYVIVGDQRDVPYFLRLQNLVNKYGLQDAVIFRQHITEEELKKEYHRAGLFILLSVNEEDHFEGFGLVFLEAAISGLPVIGTLGNGIEDAVSSENGVLVPQRDATAAADAIINILSDESRWRAMSEASIAWARQHDMDSVISQYEQAYRSILRL